MRKTMLSALIIGASVFTASAFAQASLGGAAHIGAGAHLGAAAPGAMHAVGQTTAQTEQTLHRTGSHAEHRTRRAVERARSTVNDQADANANANANATIGAGAGDSHAGANANVDTGAGLDTAATAGRAGEMGQGVGGDVRDTAHSAIHSTDRAAGSVGDAVQGVNASGSVHAHGH
ncbi:hypothetical protein [Rhodanobacter spathiphylli]|uniref:Uncharacterized protein n=1 Tax=Rhodanobacter spathiphylli B39 TaxID=1163407 RepID=I4W3C0_9GAMM|nr:hypothetical protein [Rhodanobacter spathiphylli]EIL93961.1 hypothetical protein UU7_06618 [Rhodanobacter spathiphylli B39]